MSDQEFHDTLIRELARLSGAVEGLQKGNAELAARIEKLPCLDLGPTSHAIRLDRLEQAEQRRQWVVRSAVGAALTGAVTGVIALIRGMK